MDNYTKLNTLKQNSLQNEHHIASGVIREMDIDNIPSS